MTYIDKLGKATGAPTRLWYDFLSEASHPASTSRDLYTTDWRAPYDAWQERFYRRQGPILMTDNRLRLSRFEAATTAADAHTLSTVIGAPLLDQILVIIDDYCLTSRCGELTTRQYWRRLVPVKGNRDCPDGRGKAGQHLHWWGGNPPGFQVPQPGPA